MQEESIDARRKKREIKRKYYEKIIKNTTLILLIPFTIIYAFIGYKFIQLDYLEPKEIKKNQMPSNCTATSIYYSPEEYIIENNQTKVIYYINSAFAIDGRDVTFLFSDYKCVNSCPIILTGSCWTYKTFIGKTNKDIDARFNRDRYIIWFMIYWPLIGLLLSLIYFVIYNIVYIW